MNSTSSSEDIYLAGMFMLFFMVPALALYVYGMWRGVSYVLRAFSYRQPVYVPSRTYKKTVLEAIKDMDRKDKDWVADEAIETACADYRTSLSTDRQKAFEARKSKAEQFMPGVPDILNPRTGAIEDPAVPGINMVGAQSINSRNRDEIHRRGQSMMAGQPNTWANTTVQRELRQLGSDLASQQVQMQHVQDMLNTVVRVVRRLDQAAEGKAGSKELQERNEDGKGRGSTRGLGQGTQYY